VLQEQVQMQEQVQVLQEPEHGLQVQASRQIPS
jgi:hypothetical protein